MKNIAVIISLLFLLTKSSHAQQSPIFSQYHLNGFLINPALAGSDGTVRIQLTARNYMIGVVDAPRTFTASANGRLLHTHVRVKNGRPQSNSGRVGMGGLVYSDCNGLVSRVGLQYTYAYYIDLPGATLSFGLSAAISQTHIDATRMDFNDPEPLLRDGFGNLAYVPDAVLGVFYKRQKYYIGLTAANLFQRSIRFGEFDYRYVLYRHYYLLGGTEFDISNTSCIAPSVLIKATSNGIYQGELSIRYAYNDDFWVAASWRSPQIAAFTAGMRAKRLYIGYTYEYNLSPMRTIGYGAHELNLIYRMGDSARRYPWRIRY